MGMKDDLTLGDGQTMQYTDYVSQKCTVETYMTLLANVTPINLFNEIWVSNILVLLFI